MVQWTLDNRPLTPEMMDAMELSNLSKKSGHGILSTEGNTPGPVIAPLAHRAWLQYVRTHLVNSPIFLKQIKTWIYVQWTLYVTDITFIVCPY